MKMIFESEEEKQKFWDQIVGGQGACPGELGPKETGCTPYIICDREHCSECWKNSGIEMVVENDTSDTVGLKARLERLRKFIMRIIRENDELEDAMHEAYGRCELTPNDIRFLNGLKEIEKKPPLGVMPKYIWDKKRLSELCEAVSRYWEVGEPIPIEWIEEYNELVEKANRRD